MTRRSPSTCSCYIGIFTDRDVARAIIQSDYWVEALRCESYDEEGRKQTPLRLLIKKMPGSPAPRLIALNGRYKMILIWIIFIFSDVAEDVFNRCSHSNNLPHEHPMFTITHNYEFVDDSYVSFDSDNESAKGSCWQRWQERNYLWLYILVIFQVAQLRIVKNWPILPQTENNGGIITGVC